MSNSIGQYWPQLTQPKEIEVRAFVSSKYSAVAICNPRRNQRRALQWHAGDIGELAGKAVSSLSAVCEFAGLVSLRLA